MVLFLSCALAASVALNLWQYLSGRYEIRRVQPTAAAADPAESEDDDPFSRMEKEILGYPG